MRIFTPTKKDNLPAIGNATAVILENEMLTDVRSINLDIAGREILSAEIDNCHLIKSDFSQSHLEKLVVKNTLIEKSTCIASDFTDSGWSRATIVDARCSGAIFQLSQLKDVVFRNCKLDLVNFRYAKLKRVVFDGCILSDVDFSAAELSDVVFENCSIDRFQISNAKLQRVDFAGSQLGEIFGISSMKGAIVSDSQLIAIAPYIAREIGISIQHE